MSLSPTQYAVRTAQIHAQLALVRGDISAMQPLLAELTALARAYYGIGGRKLNEQSERRKLIRRRWAETGVNRRSNLTPHRRPILTPLSGRVLKVALASSELAGVAETWRARVA